MLSLTLFGTCLFGLSRAHTCERSSLRVDLHRWSTVRATGSRLFGISLVPLLKTKSSKRPRQLASFNPSSVAPCHLFPSFILQTWDSCVASGQCGVVNRQRLDQVKEIDNCGALPHRVAGVKHQGGGCALGSFLHPSIAATGKRAKWEMKGRSGAVYGGPEQPATAPCDRCARRPPQGAVSRYVMHDSGEANADADFPPGAPHGSTFVLMDPAPPCRCAMGRANDGDSRTGNKSQRGSDVHRNLETYNPPLLWPSNGDKMARTSGQGPVKHRLRLRSSYSQQADAWGSGEPAFTSYHHLFKVW